MTQAHIRKMWERNQQAIDKKNAQAHSEQYREVRDAAGRLLRRIPITRRDA